MGQGFMDGQKEDEQKNSEKGVQEGADSPKCALRKSLRRVNSDQTIVLNVKRPQGSRVCMNSAIFQRSHGLDSRIPKDVVSLDEKFLRHCLELIHSSASKVASFKVSVNLNSSISGVPSDSLNLSNKIRVSENPDCSAQLVFDCSLASGTGKVVTTPVRQRIVGSIMESKSMVNLMRNPFFHRSGTVDANFGVSNSHDLQAFPSHGVVSSPSQLSSCSLSKQGIEIPVPGALNNHEIDPRHRKLLSMTSTNSTSTGTDKSSLSIRAPAVVSLGMLHITWKGGIPHFVFSLDEKKEIYVTSLMNTDPNNSCSSKHLYLFYSRSQGQKNVVHDTEPCLIVGRMKVTTSLSLSVNNSKVVESEFVLSTSCEASSEETQASMNNLRRNKGMPKKMIGLFKNSHSSKQRSISRVDGTANPILESSLSETSGDACSNLDALCSNEILRSYTPSNFELAAIIVRAPFRDNERQAESGGWGLKFLRRVGLKIPESLDETLPSDGTRNAGNCSTSIDVVIPAGIHGGPRTRTGGPSTLTERWKNGGQCDCGGWDLGCPLNVLRTRSTGEEEPSQADMQGNTKSLNLYLQVRSFSSIFPTHIRSSTNLACQSFLWEYL